MKFPPWFSSHFFASSLDVPRTFPVDRMIASLALSAAVFASSFFFRITSLTFVTLSGNGVLSERIFWMSSLPELAIPDRVERRLVTASATSLLASLLCRHCSTTFNKRCSW